ncbi:MAG: hypothetical protein OER86_10900, partial [Phycisphaerae bacterium]|nr:hypothetical protein [Phycisphaerae bacterium]
RTMPPGNATMTPGYGIDSTWSASHGPHGLAFLITEGYTTDARIYYCPSWTHPYHRYDVVDTTGADPNCGPNGYGGWPAPGNPGPISHRGISYIYRSSFGVDPENPNVAIAGGQPPNLRMPGTQAIVADHFNRRYVLWGQFGHNMGYSTLFLDGHTEWKEDRDSAYMDANAPAFSHGKWGVQEWLWKNFFERP